MLIKYIISMRNLIYGIIPVGFARYIQHEYIKETLVSDPKRFLRSLDLEDTEYEFTKTAQRFLHEIQMIPTESERRIFFENKGVEYYLKEQGARNELSKRQKEASVQKQKRDEKQKQKAEIEINEVMRVFQKNIIEYTKNGRIKWEKRQGYYKAAECNEVRETTYNSVKVFFRKESYYNRDGERKTNYYIKFKNGNVEKEYKANSYKSLWNIINDML